MIADRVGSGTAAAAAGLTFAAAFDAGSRVTVIVALAAAAGALALPPRRLPPWVRVPLTVPAPLLVAVLLAAHPATLPGDVGRLLRLTLPLPPDLLAVPALLTGLAATGGALIARTRPGSLAALLPSAAVAAFGLVTAGPDANQRGPALLGFAALALLTVRGAARLVRPGARGTAAALSAVAVAATPLLWLPAGVPGHAVDLRDRFAVRERLVAGTDLLDRVAGWLAAPDRDLFTVEEGPDAAAWRLAVLDRYDGETWASGARFTPAGLGVPPHDGPVPPDAVSHLLRITGLDGPYLPAVDRPVRIGPPVDAVDPEDGTLVTAGPLTPGTTYRVASVVAVAPAAPYGDPADGPLAVPAELDGDLWALTAGRDPDTVVAALRSGRRNVAGAPVSAGVPALRALLAPRGSGTGVQFAAAFALAMRLRGVPSRLVVGFQPAAGERVVRGADVRVWVELRYDRAGWVRYDPAPSPVTPEAQAPPPPPPPAAAVPGSPSSPPLAPRKRPEPWSPQVLLIVAVALAGLLCRRMIRRAWRRRPFGTPATRVLRAFHDTRDLVAVPPRPADTLTPRDVQAALTVRLGAGAPGAALTALADRALYAPHLSIARRDAGRAWHEAAAVRHALRGRR
ncbi:DUF3488 and transglutaminase-like domain-containing protein [Catenuloplanes sp. NPDC051500]|uniref:DUF3488 and transglutaminase-like domain-containing protein n=1 Tax=Catenuloplanes sp. NPDC051500 TaxID=3363959 RepID=UPI0037B02107